MKAIRCVLAILAIAATGCGKDPVPPIDPGASVLASDFQFAPATMTIAAGQVVTWSFTGGPHNVTFTDATTSGTRTAGQTYVRAFANAGTFNYACSIHPQMTGSITVQ